MALLFGTAAAQELRSFLFGKTQTVDEFVLRYGKSAVTAQQSISAKRSNGTLTAPSRTSAREILEQKVSRINSDLAAANIQSLNVGFEDQQGATLGSRVSGRSVASKTSMLAINDSVLKKTGFGPTGGAAYHTAIPIGSEKHKALMKMLKKDRIGRAGLRQARKSSSFIFMGPEVLNNAKQGSVYQSKVAFHEIGHAFSRSAGLHEAKTSAGDEIKGLISSIEKNATGRLDELFESASGFDDVGNSYTVPSKLDELKTSHLRAMTEYALEESRAEGFSHQMLDRTPNSSGTGSLLDEYFGFMDDRVKREFIERVSDGEILKADDMAGDLLSKTLSYSKIESFTKYEQRTVVPLMKAITENYYGTRHDPRIMSFFRNIQVEGKTQGQKTLLGSTDSPLVSRIQGGVKSLIGQDIDKITTNLGANEADYYSREMSELFGGLSTNRSAELSAHAAMTTESILPDLVDDASGAASAVIRSTQSGGAEILGGIRSTIRPVSIASAASKTRTSSRIISGMQTAMKVTGMIK